MAESASETARMHRMLDELLRKLEEDSAARSESTGASQARFAAELDRRIAGDEEAEADDLYRQQYERQLPSERQAFQAGRSDGSSRDELANYAMIMRGRRGQGPGPGAGGGERRVAERPARPMDDSAGFERDFQKDQTTRRRMVEMFGSREPVATGEKERILAQMAAGAQRAVENMSTPTPQFAVPGLSQPGGGELDEAALRERAMR